MLYVDIRYVSVIITRVVFILILLLQFALKKKTPLLQYFRLVDVVSVYLRVPFALCLTRVRSVSNGTDFNMNVMFAVNLSFQNNTG